MTDNSAAIRELVDLRKKANAFDMLVSILGGGTRDAVQEHIDLLRKMTGFGRYPKGN